MTNPPSDYHQDTSDYDEPLHESTDRPTGWLQRQLENASENVKSWPQWMRDAATPPDAGQPAQERWHVARMNATTIESGIPVLQRGDEPYIGWETAADMLNALEARAEADRKAGFWLQTLAEALLVEPHSEGADELGARLVGAITSIGRAREADRQRIAELEAACRENANWGEQQANRAEAAEARIAELVAGIERVDVAWQTWADARVKADREKLEAAEAERDALSDDAKQLDLLLVEAREALQRVKAERDALRDRAELADEAAKNLVVAKGHIFANMDVDDWLARYDATLTPPARRRHEAWCLTQQKDDGANGECTCGLTTPAASQEEGS